MATNDSILVDVRTPAEYSTGCLNANSRQAINIEYQLIDQLPQALSARGIDLQKTDDITLYCRSGRRSNIALQTLKNLGYSNVRDIGGLEVARALLQKEESLRSLETRDALGIHVEVKAKDDGKKAAREKAFGSLLRGLKDLD